MKAEFSKGKAKVKMLLGQNSAFKSLHLIGITYIYRSSDCFHLSEVSTSKRSSSQKRLKYLPFGKVFRSINTEITPFTIKHDDTYTFACLFFKVIKCFPKAQ